MRCLYDSSVTFYYLKKKKFNVLELQFQFAGFEILIFLQSVEYLNLLCWHALVQNYVLLLLWCLCDGSIN